MFIVRSVILFPGWFIEQRMRRKPSDPSVLEPKALASFLEREPTTLVDEDVALATYHLSRYVLTSQDN